MMVRTGCRPPAPKCLPGDRTRRSQWPSRELCIKTADKFIIAGGQEAHSPEFLCCVERRTGCFPSEVLCRGSDLQVNIWGWHTASPVSTAAKCVPEELTPAEFQHPCSFFTLSQFACDHMPSTECFLIFYHSVSVSFLTDGFACIFPG